MICLWVREMDDRCVGERWMMDDMFVGERDGW